MSNIQRLEFSMRRQAVAMACAVTGLFTLTTQAHAQAEGWWTPVIKTQQDAQSSSQRQSPQQRRATAQRDGRTQQAASQASGNYSVFGGPAAGATGAPRSAVQFPPLLEGGPRPNISPAAPQTVAFKGFDTGSIIIDTQNRALYYVLSSTTAYRYPISVGREGFTWRGTEKISRVAAWPDWRPPVEMRQRDPRLPELMTGGVNNPLGAKALYLGNSLYRIHGTNDSRTIGYAASSGCFRMMNQHVVHLATLAGPGTTVRVLDRLPSNVADSGDAAPARAKAKRAVQG
jgi:lipoprotein-anchoring transpeptidase ErfK/SrfK